MRTLDPLDFVRVYRLDPFERVRIVKTGVPPEAESSLAKRMALSTDRLGQIFGLTGPHRAT